MRSRSLAWLVFLVVAGAPAGAGAHTPPDCQLAIHIAEDRLDARVLITGAVYQSWFGREAGRISALTAAERETLTADVRTLLGKSLVVSIDGIVVSPVLGRVTVQESHDAMPLDVVTLSMSFGLKGPPRQIAITWLRYDRPGSEPLTAVSANLSTLEDFFEFELDEREPEYVWHAPRARRAPVSLEVPPQPVWTRVTIHWLSVAIMAVAVAAVPWWGRRLRSWTLRGGVVLVALALSWSTWGVAQSELSLPWRGERELPGEEQAVAIFESLHRNIYRAFDYQTENEIYDALSRSVSAGLLDEIYDEVYQSLILREEGGAICTVRAVKLLECAVELPPDRVGSEYHVQCRWRVKGTVEHWGHTHLRTNEYRARYRVGASDSVGAGGGQWRITDVDIADQQRIDSGTGGSGAANADE